MAITLLKIILFPLIPVYRIIIAVRNFLFNVSIFKTGHVNAKVVSVGNLVVGGSGKTPLVIWLAEHFKTVGYKPSVLSRGYGRKSKGYVLVHNGKKILTRVDVCGDEIYHTALECNIPAAVSEKRVAGAEKLIKDTNTNLVILDDAFQHRWIHRDINIVLFEQRVLVEPEFWDNILLPAGNLREPLSAAKRADAIIINRKFSKQINIPDNVNKYFSGKNVFTAFYKSKKIVDVVKNTEYDVKEFEGQKSLVVSGVANPVSFINALKQINVNTDNNIVFRDHKDYTIIEVEKIRKLFYSTNSHSVITTEKDAVKLAKFSKELDDIDIYYLKIEMQLDNEQSFVDFLKQKINK